MENIQNWRESMTTLNIKQELNQRTLMCQCGLAKDQTTKFYLESLGRHPLFILLWLRLSFLEKKNGQTCP